MKKIKFPLEMKDGKQVRELDEFQEYFDLGKAVEYFSNGRLQTWLESSYNDDILEEISELTGEEADFVERFTRALGVEVETGTEEIDIPEEMEKASIKEKLKQYYPEETVGKLLPFTVDSQEGLEKLLSEGCRKVYLLTGIYNISVDVHDVRLVGIKSPAVRLDAADRSMFVKQRVRLSGVIPIDEITGQMLQSDGLNDACMGVLDVLKLNLDKMV